MEMLHNEQSQCVFAQSKHRPTDYGRHSYVFIDWPKKKQPWGTVIVREQMTTRPF